MTLLAGLDDVAWGRLSHAYGSAEDVPVQLRAIAAGDGNITELFGNIVHQGTVYSATGPAVPFLVELLVASTHNDHTVTWLALLSLIADGMGYDQVHQSLHSPRIVFPDDNPIHQDEGDDDDGEEDDEPADGGDEHAWVSAAHNAVCAAWSLLAPLLSHDDSDVRMATASLLGRLHGCGADAMRALLAHRDNDATVRAMVTDAVSRLLMANADNQAWRLHPSMWTSPVSSQPQLVDDALAHCHRAAQSTGIERLIAVDALTTAGVEIVVSAHTLAADFVEAEKIIDSVEDWTHRRFFGSDPALSMAVISQRLQHPTVPDRVVYDAQEWIESRRHRGSAVAVLAQALLHPNDDVAMEVASLLRTMGGALRDVVPVLEEAIARRPMLGVVLVRPLRVLGHPLGDTLFHQLCIDGDDGAMAFNAPLLRAGDPQACQLFAKRLAELFTSDASDELRTSIAARMFAERSRSSESTMPVTAPNVRSSLLAALLAAEAAPISLLLAAARSGMSIALQALCTRVDEPGVREVLTHCAIDPQCARDHDALRRALITDDNDPAWDTFAASLRSVTNHLPWEEIARLARKPAGSRARSVVDGLLPRWRWLAQQTAPDWSVVRCQVGLWSITRDADDILPGLYAQLVSKLSGHRALQLLLEMGAHSDAIPALLQEDDAMPWANIEQDEAWLADLRKATLL